TRCSVPSVVVVVVGATFVWISAAGCPLGPPTPSCFAVHAATVSRVAAHMHPTTILVVDIAYSFQQRTTRTSSRPLRQLCGAAERNRSPATHRHLGRVDG